MNVASFNRFFWMVLSFMISWTQTFILSFVCTLILSSCYGQSQEEQEKSEFQNHHDTLMDGSGQGYVDPYQELKVEDQLMLVLRRIFQDSEDNIWFVGDDVFCWTGDSLIDYSAESVFDRKVIRQIAEDKSGNIWFGTSGGVVRYQSDGSGLQKRPFTLFEHEEPYRNDVWSLEVDKEGLIWVGAYGGVSQFDGEKFIDFPLPETEPDRSRGVSSPWLVHDIMQDSKGQMWFGTNGGAYLYDGSSLSSLTEKDGLCHNTINDILEDDLGNIWYATHHAGICYWDGESFTHLGSSQGVEGTEGWSLYEDKSGDIWFPLEHSGVYRYSPDKDVVDQLANYREKEGLNLRAVHTVLEDNTGAFWFGGFGGLYRYDGEKFTNMTKNGLWPGKS